MSIRRLQIEILDSFSKIGVENTVNISKYCKINQSTVHRNLYGKPKRVTKTLKILCKYAKVELSVRRSDPRDNELLMKVLGDVWDGTDDHAKVLARLITVAHNC